GGRTFDLQARGRERSLLRGPGVELVQRAAMEHEHGAAVVDHFHEVGFVHPRNLVVGVRSARGTARRVLRAAATRAVAGSAAAIGTATGVVVSLPTARSRGRRRAVSELAAPIVCAAWGGRPDRASIPAAP